MKASIKEIAKTANVSIMTVSRALRNKQGVSETKRNEIKDIAKRMGYIPNAVASSFSSRKTNAIGVIIPFLEHTIFPSMLRGIEEVLSKKDYSIFLCCSYEDSHKESKEIEALLSRRVDGIIWVPCSIRKSISAAKTIKEMKCPFVFMDRIIPSIQNDSIISDDYQGACDATRHLIKTGCKRIAHITSKTKTWISEERLRGYTDTLKAYNLKLEENLIFKTDLTVKGGKEAMSKLLKSSNSDSIFCVNDTVAIGCFLYAKENSIKMPDDLSLIGFSSSSEAEYLNISSVFQDSFNIGRQAAIRIVDKINSDNEVIKKEIFSAKLITRGTTINN
jgi:LacI family transcriptional regulator